MCVRAVFGTQRCGPPIQALSGTPMGSARKSPLCRVAFLPHADAIIAVHRQSHIILVKMGLF